MLSGKAQEAPSGAYTLSSSREDAERWLRARVGKVRRLVFDIETAGGLVRHPAKREILCLGLFDGTEAFVIPEDQLYGPDYDMGYGWVELYDLLSQFGLVGHNAKFDTMTTSWVLLRKNKPLKVDFDTQIVHGILYPAAQKHALDFVVEKFYGWPSWSLTQAEYNDMRSVPLDKLYTYLAKDVQGTGVLAGDLFAMVAQNDNAARVWANVLGPLNNLLAKQQFFGVCIWTKYVAEELVPEVQSEIDVALAGVQDKADKILENCDINPDETWPRSHGPGSVKGKPVWVHKFNPGSPNQVKKLYEAQGISLKSTDEDALSVLIEKGDEFAPRLLDYRGATKLMGTYVRPKLDVPPKTLSSDLLPGDRVFPDYKLFGVITGRLSSADPNIQNQPRQKRIRRSFRAGWPGHVLMQADYSQAELRVMAALGNDKWLIDIFADPDVDVFEQMLPMAFPHRVPRNAEEKKEMRALLKGVIYGLAFGRQAKAIAHALGMHPAEAQRIIDNFLGAATGLAGWRESVFKRLHSGEGLRTRHGRYFQNDVITPRNKAAVERSALSFEPQSSASDCCVKAAVELFKWIEDSKKPWYLMALVHDSITLDVPEGDAEEASEVTRAMLVKHGQAVFPEVVFAADGGWGKTWDKTG